ncbi:MAG: hypothetical protein JWP78_1247 [Mucilaginibacter sp.]|nr:hypothetical protein [Mucilaginibacter sp.]
MLYPSLIGRLKNQHASFDVSIAHLDSDRLTRAPRTRQMEYS